MNRRVEAAVLNNAGWCDAVCRAHGRPGEFLANLWLNPRETPRFYPNAITLVAEEPAAQVERIVAAFAEEAPRAAWAVKDSFRTLDLEPHGFRALFDAQWFWCAADVAARAVRLPGARSSRVRTPRGLEAWEAAWSAGQSGDRTRVFLPPLLDEPDIAVIAVERDEQLVAGAIGNRSGEVVGLSNFFAGTDDVESLLAECVASVTTIFPGQALVSYDAGRDLEALLRLGCETVGPLRVWVT